MIRRPPISTQGVSSAASDVYTRQPHANADSRSLMNITWRLADEELEAVFLDGATAAGFGGLKGHRSVGGIRASLYNGCPISSVEALVGFMRDFEAQH